MNKEPIKTWVKDSIILLLIAVAATIGLMVYLEAKATVLDKDECYDVGVNNGKGTGPFHPETFRHCEKFNDSGDYEKNPYYKGFIKGCTESGNDRDTCERFIE